MQNVKYVSRRRGREGESRGTDVVIFYGIKPICLLRYIQHIFQLYLANVESRRLLTYYVIRHIMVESQVPKLSGENVMNHSLVADHPFITELALSCMRFL